MDGREKKKSEACSGKELEKQSEWTDEKEEKRKKGWR
jgi:hypothetical protein